MDQRFRRKERLGTRREYDAVFEHHNVAAGEWIVVFGRPNGLDYNRLGLTVSRRFGIAVLRNRFERWCRESFRRSKDRQPQGFDWVVLPRLPKRESAGARRGRPRRKDRLAGLRLKRIENDLLSQMHKIAHRERRRTEPATNPPPAPA